MLVTGSGAGGRARKAHPRSPVCVEGVLMGWAGGLAQGMGSGFNQYFLCPFVFLSCCHPLLFFPPL